MPTTPPWSAAQSGLPGELDATNHAAQVGQELGTHSVTVLYDGTTPILTPDGGTQFFKLTPGNTLDISQPFTLVGTSVGRVVLPITYGGLGADVLVSLHPDSAGSPNMSINLASVLVPAIVIRNEISPTGLENATTALQTATRNTTYFTNSITVVNWASPTGDSTGVAANSSIITDGNFMIFIGGFTGGHGVATVATAEYQGDTVLALPALRPSLPQAAYYVNATVSTNSVVAAGGYNGSAPIASVWTASWDVNTGTIGAWSAQTSLPTATFGAGVAHSGDTVYVVGGSHDAVNATSSFVHTVVDNGQISGWTSGPSLPQAVVSPMLAVCSGWLICAGGSTSVSGGSAVSNVWVAKIQDDGTIDGWVPGPDLLVAVFAYAPGWDITTTDHEVVIVGGFLTSGVTAAVQILSVSETEIGTWRRSEWNPSNVQAIGAFAIGDGTWQVINPVTNLSIYRASTLEPTGLLSVPLVATGLTNGAVYHVVMQQHQTGTGSDYLAIGLLDDTPLPIAALQSDRHSGSWSTIFPGWSVPMQVYSTSVGDSADVVHTWEDSNVDTGSAISNNVAAAFSTTYHDYLHQLIGHSSVVGKPNDPLNVNPTFTTGTAPWTAVNATITQSSAQTHGGFPFSGLITPTGGFSQAYAQSELEIVPELSNVVLGDVRWLMANSWVYSPAGYASFSLSISWFDRGQTLISTSSNVVSLSAGVWTNVVEIYLVPATAQYAAIVPTLSGNPTSSDVVYLSNATLKLSPETATSFASVITVDRDPTGFPSGTSQLT